MINEKNENLGIIAFWVAIIAFFIAITGFYIMQKGWMDARLECRKAMDYGMIGDINFQNSRGRSDASEFTRTTVPVPTFDMAWFNDDGTMKTNDKDLDYLDYLDDMDMEDIKK